MKRLVYALLLVTATAMGQIKYLRIANIDRWNDGHATHGCMMGDVNTSTWAADGKVYMVSDDAYGYFGDTACTTGTGTPGLLPTQLSRWNSDRTSPTRAVNSWDVTLGNMLGTAAAPYGASFSPAYTWKGTGILAYNGKKFIIVCWQQYSGVQPSGPCSMVYTSDLANFISPQGTNVIPPYGTSAIMVGGAQNYTITSGSNDSLTLAIDGSSTTVTLTAGTRTAAQIAADINAAIAGSHASVAGTLLKVVSSTTGASSTILASGTARATLGLPSYTINGNSTFGKTYRSGSPFFVQYGQEGSSFPNVDQAGTYAYVTSCDNGSTALWNDGDYCRLGRVAFSDLDAAPFDSTKWKWYNSSLGACDSTTSNANCWDTTDANATAILTDTGHLSMSSPFWVPQQKIAGSSSGRYLWPQWYLTGPSAPHPGTVVWYEAPSLVGPWTKIAVQSEPEKGWYNLSPWQPSLYDTSTPLTTLTVSGDWASTAFVPSDARNLYTIHFMDVELSAVPFAPSVNFIRLPRSTKFAVAETTNRAAEFEVFYDFAGATTGTTVPDLSGNGHTGTFVGTAGPGPGALANYSASAGYLNTGIAAAHSRPLTICAIYVHRISRVGTNDDLHHSEMAYHIGNPTVFSRTNMDANSWHAAFNNAYFAPAALADYVWHVVYNRWNADGTIDQFADGVLVNSGPGSTGTAAANAVTVTGIPGNAGYELNGLLRTFYMRNRAMTDAEIADETSYWRGKMAAWANTTK